MTTKTANLDILNSLIEAGVNKEDAERLASEILTREEASITLATKPDIAELKIEVQSLLRSQTQWVAAMLVTQALAIVGLIRFLG